MAKSKQVPTPANDTIPKIRPQLEASAKLGNIVIGFVGYLGAGCTEIADRLKDHLEGQEYKVFLIKASELIEDYYPAEKVVQTSGESDGPFKLRRTKKLQDLGDRLRHEKQHSAAVAGLALRQIQSIRGDEGQVTEKYVFLVDSLKHPKEVESFRAIYGGNFRLISVFSDRDIRERRLIGERGTAAKFRGVPSAEVQIVLERDEEDNEKAYGQQVRRTFYLGDFFLNNNTTDASDTEIDTGIHRFVDLIVGAGIHRPTPQEYGMYHAFAASLRSSCLSRQVGAVITNAQGIIVATGMNEVPRFGGGTYDGDPSRSDHRCHVWEYKDGKSTFIGCHKDRKNIELRHQITNWLSSDFLEGVESFAALDEHVRVKILEEIGSNTAAIKRMPGVRDIIEYSRSIHAEMDAITACVRSGISTLGSTLYCTTYPCHNCARHLVAAGMQSVFYIEPYVKSQAIDLHSDAIGETLSQCEKAEADGTKIRLKMLVSAFTGVGPRMYEDHFMKRIELKDESGVYIPPQPGRAPVTAIPIGNIIDIESSGIKEILGDE